jgi:hypothetical protein
MYNKSAAGRLHKNIKSIVAKPALIPFYEYIHFPFFGFPCGKQLSRNHKQFNASYCLYDKYPLGNPVKRENERQDSRTNNQKRVDV